MTRPDRSAVGDLEIRLRGDLPPDTRDYALAKLSSVLKQSPEPVLHARVKVTRHGDPAVHRAVVVQINLDLNGRVVRVHADGATAHQAIIAAHAKLRRRLPEFARHWEARRGASDGESWRHGTPPAKRPHYFPRPAEEREVVRRKAFALAVESVDEAVDEMERMDYDFHLFTEAGTGQDSVVYRAGPTGYRLAQVQPHPSWVAPYQTMLTFSEQPAPELSLSEAVQRLNLAGTPFLFFCDTHSGRGAVLYHRYDGHYGLITPAS